MNDRQKTILRILLTQAGEFLLGQDIAEKVGCSEKTVRSDLKVIEEFLKRRSDAKIIRKPGLGIFLEIDKDEKARLYNDLHVTNGRDIQESDDERVVQIAYHLLMSVKPLTAQDLSSRYFVAKSAIKKDLDLLEVWLKKFNLTLVTKQKVGLHVEGFEKDKRSALSRLSELLVRKEPANLFLKKQFLPHEVDMVIHELKEMQQKQHIFFTDETVEGLTVHILLMIKRSKLNQSISTSNIEIMKLKNKKEYAWAIELLKKLEKSFYMHFSEAEIAYLALRLLGGKVRYSQNTEGQNMDDLAENHPVLNHLVESLIVNMSALCMVDFKEDEVLMNGLKVHLYTTLNRLKYDLAVSNPMLNEIKKLYPYMFDMMIHVLEEVDETKALNIPEEEAGYLTLHFQASLERLKNKKTKVKNVLIVCHMGVGMSQLLRTKVEQRFHHVHIMDCVAKAELNVYLKKHKVDVIISTTSLTDLRTPHIVVSPLLENSDVNRLEDFLKKQDNPEKKGFNDSVLLKYTTPFLVFLHENTTNKYELIEKLAAALHKKEYVEKEYTQNAIVREKMSATTIGSGIAIPHGHPSFVKHSSIAVATLQHPIEWGAEKVSIVLMLAIKNEDREGTQQLFREISYMSSQPEMIQTLLKEKDILSFLSLYKQFIKQGH
ncbi:BglG family transcription antiterminator [Fictibacillus barbaricus]|uniref:BglG family transcription antiterminator n=1 Tax=Fictibacillus barbaricus TaxID=182136 RepID=A0ABS2Z7J3_9BACL|nr:BglG family transcription antiterminator [Fictibacillus barbaricus]MBN3543923.1 BglG family transcription antiterminator [Fictibacillus barbaricus]GGB71755.1 transcriptional regulator ManR [Fictibacillus barbaricus]